MAARSVWPTCPADRGAAPDSPVRHWLTLVDAGFLWDDENAAYIASRSSRYPGAIDVDPGWTQEVFDDEQLVVLDPYPSSRVGACGFIGRSSTAARVLVVIAYQDIDGDWHGLNAWPASGRDLATYNEGADRGETT